MPVNDCYFTARARPGSQVRASPLDDALVLVEASDGLPRGLCLPVCTHDLSHEDAKWVRVVVAGFGFGWIRSSDVEEATSYPPASPCITSLTLKRPRFEVSATLELIELLGAKMVSLSATRNETAIDSSGVLPILRAFLDLNGSMPVTLDPSGQTELIRCTMACARCKVSS